MSTEQTTTQQEVLGENAEEKEVEKYGSWNDILKRTDDEGHHILAGSMRNALELGESPEVVGNMHRHYFCLHARR